MKVISVQDLKDVVCDMGYEDALVFENPDYADAAVGVSEDGRVIYDYDKMAEHLVEKDQMTFEEAVDFIEYNTIRALPYFAPNAPIILHAFYDDD